jgi:hypothetical protein
MPGRVVKNAPFTADIVTESNQALPDGNRIRRATTVRMSRDSDGRTRREQSLQNLNGLGTNSDLPQVAFINDPVAGAGYALDLGKRTATKVAWNRGGRLGAAAPDSSSSSSEPRPMSRFGAPGAGPDGAAGGRGIRGRASQNVRTESLGRQVIEGVPADGVRSTMTIPAGQMGNEQPIQVVSETWHSPDLQVVVLRKHSDPRSGETVTRYTNISRAEPSRMLFEPPADFKLVENPRGSRPRQ